MGDEGAPDGGPDDGGGDAPAYAPEVTCGEDDLWTTIGRAAVVYGEATDDGWITSWTWTVTSRPAGSVVDPYPVHAPTTSLTPDAEGVYELELTVVDDAGLEATCTVVVHSIVGPPVAFCPDDVTGAVVGRPYTLEGDGFDDELLVGFSWAVTARPPESRAEPVPADEPVTTFTPDVAGRFELTLTAVDNDGETGSCTVAVVSSGPPTAICPPEVSAPTRRPVSIAGDAEDDGTIALWSWELLEAPRGSTATPSPETAQTTTLTPDRVGRYALRLTVTDDTGLTDSCETAVNATPTGPDAICPDPIDTTPLTEVTIRGDGEDDGEIVGWEWELVATPAASSAAPPEPADEQVTRFMPDVAGEYTLRLTVVDDDGMEGSCETLVRAIPGEGFRVELYWNPPDRSCDTHPGSGCDSTDVDLHLLHSAAPGWFDGTYDCYYANCQWTPLPWDSAAGGDDPRLDLDDTEGFGPENINIDEPAVGHTYQVGVHFFSADSSDEPAQAYVRIYCGTIDVSPVYEVGPVAIRAPGGSDHDFWRVASVAWDGVRCAVTPRTSASGGPDIVTESVARSSP